MTIVRTALTIKKEREAKAAASAAPAAGGAFQTVDHFVMIFKLILNRPGITQTLLVKATGFSKAKVSKLCSQGVAQKMFEKYNKGYLPGPVIKDYANSYIKFQEKGD
jgi:hypothetical protein